MAPTGITGNMETLASVDTFIIHWDFGESGSSYNIDVVSMTNTTSGEPGSSTRSGFEIFRSNSLNWPLNIQQLVVGHISYSTIVIGPFKLCRQRISNPDLDVWQTAVRLHLVWNDSGRHVDDARVRGTVPIQPDLVTDDSLSAGAPVFVPRSDWARFGDPFSDGDGRYSARLSHPNLHAFILRDIVIENVLRHLSTLPTTRLAGDNQHLREYYNKQKMIAVTQPNPVN